MSVLMPPLILQRCVTRAGRQSSMGCAFQTLLQGSRFKRSQLGALKSQLEAARTEIKSCERQLSFQPGNITGCCCFFLLYLPLPQIKAQITSKLAIAGGKIHHGCVKRSAPGESRQLHRVSQQEQLAECEIFILLKCFGLVLHELFCDLVLQITLWLYRVSLRLSCFHCS